MSQSEGGLQPDQADAIYDALIEFAGAPSDADARYQFVLTQTDRFCSEYRFIGALGFGGKFWRINTKRPDGTWGPLWCVHAYREDMTPERQAIIDRTDEVLWLLQQRMGTA